MKVCYSPAQPGKDYGCIASPTADYGHINGSPPNLSPLATSHCRSTEGASTDDRLQHQPLYDADRRQWLAVADSSGGPAHQWSQQAEDCSRSL